jgi:hypothetical protein
MVVPVMEDLIEVFLNNGCFYIYFILLTYVVTTISVLTKNGVSKVAKTMIFYGLRYFKSQFYLPIDLLMLLLYAYFHWAIDSRILCPLARVRLIYKGFLLLYFLLKSLFESISNDDTHPCSEKI